MNRVALNDLATALKGYGLDLCQTFDSHAYNAQVNAEHQLPDFGRRHAQGLLIGNTRALWPVFLAWYEALGAKPSNPVDNYVEFSVMQALAAIDAIYKTRWAHRAEPYHIGFQRLAQACGLAYLSGANLSVHPEYGPWIALRAAVVFDCDVFVPSISPAPQCEHCGAACLPAFEHALALTKQGTAPVAAHWETWLKVRDACPQGVEHRYSEQQIRYHYTKDVAALNLAAPV